MHLRRYAAGQLASRLRARKPQTWRRTRDSGSAWWRRYTPILNSYDKHVTVSIENGDVVLRGFVFSDWDLRRALNIARKAAGAKTVVDNLSIKEGDR
jgi:hypothetical protein